MYLSPDDILDLTVTTLHDYGPPKFSQIAQNLQSYEMMGRWLKKDKVEFQGGIGIKRVLLAILRSTARHKGLYATDSVAFQDILKQITIPWKHMDNYWGFDITEEKMNRGKALVTNIIKPRREECLISIAEELEEKAWSCPSEENDEPYGIPYYIVMNVSEGFNGAAPSGWSTVAGVNPTSVPKWKNYTATFDNITADDLIPTWARAFRYINFKSPQTIPDFRNGLGNKMRNYMKEATLNSIEQLARKQNNQLGADLGSMDSVTTFKRTPLIWAPQLETATVGSSNPIYMINHDTFYPIVLSGAYLNESGPRWSSESHTVIVNWMDLSYNFFCGNRRANAVLYEV